MGCLDEQTIVAFVSGALAGDKLAEAEHHLLRCPDCATLVALAAPITGTSRRQNTLEWAGAPPTDEASPQAEPAPGPPPRAAPIGKTSGIPAAQPDGGVVDLAAA